MAEVKSLARTAAVLPLLVVLIYDGATLNSGVWVLSVGGLLALGLCLLPKVRWRRFIVATWVVCVVLAYLWGFVGRRLTEMRAESIVAAIERYTAVHCDTPRSFPTNSAEGLVARYQTREGEAREPILGRG